MSGIKGFDSFEKQIKNIQNQLESASHEIGGQVSFEVLFNQGFMEKHSKFSTIDDFFKKGNLDISSQEEYEKLPEEVLDKLTQENTSFLSWHAMLEKAAYEHMIKGLKKKGFDIG